MSKKPKPEAGKKLPEKELVAWKARISIAKMYLKRYGNAKTATNIEDGRWDANIKALDGDFGTLTRDDEGIDVNMTLSTMQTLFSPLWTSDPYITITATREKYVAKDGSVYDNIMRARLCEYELNYWTRETGLRQVVKQNIIDAGATNCGYAYVGYVKSNKDLENDEGEITEPNPLVRFKKPFFKRVKPDKVLIPPGYYDIEDCPWIALVWAKEVCDVKDRYGVDDLKSDTIGFSEEEIEKEASLSADEKAWLKSDEAGYVDLIQIWDKRSRKLITITRQHDDALAVEPWPVKTEGFPLSKLRFTFTPDQGFGMPWMSAWMAQQYELNQARTASSKRNNRTKSVVFMDGEVADAVIDQYKKAQDGEIIKVPTGDKKINEVMMIDPGLPMADSQYAAGQIAQSDLHQISGLGSQMRGQGDPNANTATSSALIDKWAQIRQTDYGDCVRTHYLNCVKKLWMILQQFPDVERDMLVTGPDGQMQRIKYTLGELEGEFAFSMDIGSLIPEDPTTRLNNAIARYEMLGADPLFNRERLGVDVLRASNVRDIEAYLTRLMTPEVEMQRMMQGLPVEPHELDDHNAHLAAHEVQMQQIMEAMGQIQQEDPQYAQLQQALALSIAHVNATMMILMQIDSKAGGGGKPQKSNKAKAALADGGNARETPAETGGQPLDGTVQTDATIQ